MKNIKLNSTIDIDLSKLIDSKLLIQANSGGGKSWAIRRLVEQAFGKVQIIILDPEGEFANLRERDDFILCGKGADVPAESRSAEMLARKLLELKNSAIIDLYELHPQDRKHFVKLFLQALLNAPKELWPIRHGDCLVILDEAHVFAPEKGESEALSSVTGMASQGRKRGLGLILATQRISKLNKDAAAECNNKLIGRASLDIDRKRAAEELGFTTKEQILSLRDLEPGEFYTFGPAISRDVIKTIVGDVKAKPPGRGTSTRAVPTPTDKVKKILAKLADLPQEAAKEVRTIAELKQEIATLKRAQTVRKQQSLGGIDQKSVEKEVKAATMTRDKEWKAKIDDERKWWKNEVNKFYKAVHDVQQRLAIIGTPNYPLPQCPQFIIQTGPEKGKISSHGMPELSIDKSIVKLKPIHPFPARMAPEIVNEALIEAENEGSLSGPEQRVLNAIAWCESIDMKQPPNELVAFLSGYSHYRSTGYTNPRSYLKTKGLIDYSAGSVFFTEAGRALAHAPESPLTQEELHRAVLNRLDGPEKRLLQPLLEAYPDAISNADLCQKAGYMHERSTGYTNPRSRLKSFGLIDYGANGVIARDILFI